MLRDPASGPRLRRIAAWALVLALVAGCGIKGPLRLPPPPETASASPATTPAPSSGTSVPTSTAPSEDPPPKAK